MGCAASKLDNEDTVRRCKERSRLMTESVKARHHLAAAHADYCRSLRLTGSALSSFAAGESLAVSDQTPAVFLHTHTPHVPPSPSVYTPPPPPPVSVPPSSRGPSSVASSNLSKNLSQSRRRKKQQQQRKLPHILSSPSSSPKSERSNFMPNSNFYPSAYQNSNYSASPSQASSVWNWENFYPPSPPDSEFFNRKAQERQQQNRFAEDFDGDDTGTERSEMEFNHFRKQKKQIESMEEETEREEVQCSEWDDHGHYSTTSSSDAEEEEEGDRESVSEIGARSDFGSMRSSSMRRQAKPVPPEEYGEEKFRKRDDDATSYRSGASDMKMVVRHRDLKEIVDAIQENFDKAASSGDQVSQMLHLGKAQLDRNFSQLKSEFWW